MKLNPLVQQDPHELLLLLFDRLKFPGGKTLKSEFAYQESCILSCQKCGIEKTLNTISFDFGVSVDESDTLYNAILRTSASNNFVEDTEIFCEFCHQNTQIRSSTVVKNPPNVLFIRLIRYYYDKTEYNKKKTFQSLNIDLNLTIFGQDYELDGIIYHLGYSANSGHYVCEVKDWETNHWWRINDNFVEKVPTEDLKSNLKSSDHTRNIYLLFYSKASSKSFVSDISDDILAQENISKENRLFQLEIDSYQSKECLLKELFNSRRFTYSNSFFNCSQSSQYYIIPRNLLESWILGETFTFTELSSNENLIVENFNSQVLCPHSCLNIFFISEMKVINCGQYNAIFSDPAMKRFSQCVFSHKNYQCKICTQNLKFFLDIIYTESVIVHEVIDNLSKDSNLKNGFVFLDKYFLFAMKNYLQDLVKFLECVSSAKSIPNVPLKLKKIFYDNYSKIGDGTLIRSEYFLNFEKHISKQMFKIGSTNFKVLQNFFKNTSLFNLDLNGFNSKNWLNYNFQKDPSFQQLTTKKFYNINLDINEQMYIVDKISLLNIRNYIKYGNIKNNFILNESIKCFHNKFYFDAEIFINFLHSPIIKRNNEKVLVKLNQDLPFEIFDCSQWDQIKTVYFQIRDKLNSFSSDIFEIPCRFELNIPPIVLNSKLCEDCCTNLIDKIRDNFEIEIFCSNEEDNINKLISLVNESFGSKSRIPRNKKKFESFQLHVTSNDTISFLKLKIYEKSTLELPPHLQNLYNQDGIKISKENSTLRDNLITKSSKLFVIIDLSTNLNISQWNWDCLIPSMNEEGFEKNNEIIIID